MKHFSEVTWGQKTTPQIYITSCLHRENRQINFYMKIHYMEMIFTLMTHFETPMTMWLHYNVYFDKALLSTFSDHTISNAVQSYATSPNVGMPLLTRCHWQCLDRLSQIFATLCKVCFYGWFSIENEVNAGNFCPELNHWALLSVQFGCFSKKIEYFGK